MITSDNARTLLNTITSKGLYSFLIFFKSPISNAVEEQHIYTDSFTEGTSWLESVSKAKTALNIEFCVYINGAFEDSSCGFQFDSQS